MVHVLKSRAGDQFPMSDEVYRAFQKITLEVAGIELADSKRAMVATRFTRRLNALKLNCFEDYLSRISRPDGQERASFIDTVTTNLTYFFREPHHFEYLAHLLELHAQNNRSGKLRIWSAGCSSGQEPYSIGMTVSDSDAVNHCEARILCTDIHTEMLEQAQLGHYKQEELRGLSDEHIERWSTPVRQGTREMNESLRSLLITKHLNLFDRWPVRSGVDIIFCRNVLIYFDQQHQTQLLRGFAAAQARGAHLFLGHSENIRGCEDVYKRVENTVYERR